MKMAKQTFQTFAWCLLLITTGLWAQAQDNIIMHNAPTGSTNIDETPAVHFFDPAGVPNELGDAEDRLGGEEDTLGYFTKNIKDTITLRSSLTNGGVLSVLFTDFVMGYGDTLYIFDGQDCSADLIGFYNSVRSPEQIFSTGRYLTFVFHSDNIDDPGVLSTGWDATVYAYRNSPMEYTPYDGLIETCNGKFYDTGGPNGNIAAANENVSCEIISAAFTHVKLEFQSFNVNGLMKIYDGQMNDPNKRLIGQFCKGTLPTNGKPPVIFSTTQTIYIEYIGAAGDDTKPGWEATISCVPELFEAPEGSACPSVTIVRVENDQDFPFGEMQHHCSEPVMLKANVVATGKYAGDYTVTSIPFNPPVPFTQGTSLGASSDDNWLSPVTLGFKFTFFGQNYQQVYPGTNALISLNAQTAGEFCSYSYVAPPATPNSYSTGYANVPYNYANSIYGVYQDVHCSHYSNNGAVRKLVTQDPPCRKFVFNYDHIALYGHNSGSGSSPNEQDNGYYNTFQMVLYEGTNIIDVYVKHCSKGQTATECGGQEGVIGLQNAKSSQIIIAPGRGVGFWANDHTQQANDEAWRFTPVTPLDEDATIDWYENDTANVSIGQTMKLIVDPQETTSYIAKYVFTNAGGDHFVLLDTVKLVVTVPEVEPTNNSNDQTCPGSHVTLQAGAGSMSGVTPESYLWSNGSTEENPVIVAQETGDVSVTVTFSNNCKRTESTTVNVTPMEFPMILGDTAICKGESTTLHAVMDDPAYTIQWEGGPVGNDYSVTPEDTTAYVVRAILGGDCFTTDTFTVNVMPLPRPRFTVAEEVVVNNTIGTAECFSNCDPSYALHWDFDDKYSSLNIVTGEPNPTHDYTHSGYYNITLTATDTNNCRDSISHKVHVYVPYYYYVPNSFTPDGDGLNERWEPKGEGVDPEKFFMCIFDRNGYMLFKTTNPYDYWDGRSKDGRLCPAGVYVYSIKLWNLNNEYMEYNGAITLIR